MSDSFYSQFNGIGGGGGGSVPSCCFIVQCGTGASSTQRICASNNAFGAFSGALGKGNSSCGEGSAIMGGATNTIGLLGCNSFIGGGESNQVTNPYSSILGGLTNRAIGGYSTIGGGICNTASAIAGFIGGGNCNNVCNPTSGCLNYGQVVVGGVGNNTTGGTWNIATCSFSVAPTNLAQCSRYSFIGGGFQNATCQNSSYGFIGGGSRNAINESSYSNIVGGTTNCISNSTQSFIGAGSTNIISANTFVNGGAIVAGYLNKICGFGGNTFGQEPIIGGGRCNTLCLDFTSLCDSCYDGNHFLGGGTCNIVGTSFSAFYEFYYPNVLVGGYANCSIGCSNSVVVGGYCNVAYEGGYNFIGGGCCNLANYLGNIVGGSCNSAVGGFIGAGSCNIITSNTFQSAIVTGFINSITSIYNSFIGAGCYNVITNAKDSTILNGSCNSINTGGSSPPNLFIGSGFKNTICCGADSNTIINGNFNFSNAQFGFIGDGINNVTCNLFVDTSAFATIVNGVGNNTTGGTFSLANCCFTIAPTCCNAGQYSFIGNGFQNRATGVHSSVLSGQNNTASSNFSVILGGCNNVNDCACSLVAGNSITADRNCTLFVNNLSIKSIPTASTGLPSGAVWRCTTDNTLRIIP